MGSTLVRSNDEIQRFQTGPGGCTTYQQGTKGAESSEGEVMNKLTVILVGLFITLGYQNCSNSMKFAQDGALVSKFDANDTTVGGTAGDGSTVPPSNDSGSTPGCCAANPPSTTPPSTMPPGNGDTPYVPPPTAGYPPGTTPPGSVTPPKYPPTAGNGGTRTCHGHTGSNHSSSHHDADDDDDDSTMDDDAHHNGQYNNATSICILQGPGESVKLGVRSGKLSGQSSAVETVCMSERACREIVSKGFEVKGPSSRGYCKNGGAHSRHMTDEEVSQAVIQVQMSSLQSKL